MTSPSRKCFVPCLCLLVLGVLIGISIDAEFRPNRIRFWVNAIGDLSFIPQQGDTIEWHRQSPDAPLMTITFYGGPNDSPCVAGRANPCTIKNIPQTTVYTYSCKAQEDSNFTCNDPQGGPQSVTGVFNTTRFFVKIVDLVDNILAVINEIFFGHSSHSGTPGVTQNTPGATQNIAGNTATAQAETVKTPSDGAKSSAKLQGIGVTVYCDSTNTTDVIAPQQSSTPNVAILASVGQQILWTTPSANGFTITMNDPSTCKENTSTFGPNSICTFAKPGSFTAVAPSCPANTAESIAVQ